MTDPTVPRPQSRSAPPTALLTVMALLLASCGSEPAENGDQPAPPAAGSQTGKAVASVGNNVSQSFGDEEPGGDGGESSELGTGGEDDGGGGGEADEGSDDTGGGDEFAGDDGGGGESDGGVADEPVSDGGDFEPA